VRTKITLEPDNEKPIRDIPAKRSGVRRFAQKTYALGVEQNFCWDKVLSTADAIEDEELSRKLSLHKWS
jgi:hypothetical protein